jgi:HK97 family phage portal protein
MIFNAIAGDKGAGIPGVTDDFWYSSVATLSASGVRVSPYTAMRCSSVYACVKVLAESIASTPRLMCERLSDNSVQMRPQHPLQDVLDMSPNTRQTAFEFWEMQIAFGCLYGNSYAAIIPGRRGAVDQLVPLRPDCVRVELLQNDRLRYTYTDPITSHVSVYNQDEIFKIPGFSFNGVEGIAPIFFAQDPIGLALVTEQYGSRFFTNDATPAIVLQHPKVLTAGAAERIKKTWRDMHAGLKNAYSVAVLEEGMEAKPLTSLNKDSQFMETRRYQIAEVARYLRVPLHMIGELERSTNNNIEQQAIEFVKYTLRPWVKRIEQRVSMELITSPKFFMRHDLDDLMRGEMLPRYQAHQIGATVGFLTRNEIRAKEGLNPLPGLDQPLTPMNMGQGQGGADNQPNPNSTPQGGQSQNVNDITVPTLPVASDSATARACSIAVRDAFDRIIASEVAGVKSLAKKITDPAAQVGAVESFYTEKHATYMAKTLAPVSSLCKSFGLSVPDLAEYVASYAAHRATEILAATDVVVYLEKWIETASANLTSGWFMQEEHAQ